MFFMARIKNWWGLRRRHLFAYFDGERVRYADPVRVHGRFEDALPDYVSVLADAFKNLKNVPVGSMRDEAALRKKEATAKVLAAARKIFDLAPFCDGPNGRAGTTDGEAIAALGAFLAFMNAAAEDAELFANSPAAA